MGINLRKVKIINNTGAVNVGDCYDLSPLAVAKVYAGAGGSSAAIFKWKRHQKRSLEHQYFFRLWQRVHVR